MRCHCLYCFKAFRSLKNEFGMNECNQFSLSHCIYVNVVVLRIIIIIDYSILINSFKYIIEKK